MSEGRRVVRVVIARQVNVERLDAWWRKHRSAAPFAFARAFALALEWLEAMPEAAPHHPHARLQNVRRLTLGTGHQLYYQVSRQTPQLWIVNVIDLRGPKRRQL